MNKIKVLQFICPNGYYGAERWIIALAKNLDRSKIDCQLSVTHESDTQNIEISKRFRRLGLDSHEIKMNGRLDPLAIFKLCNLIRQDKIDIIHTHGYKSDILGFIAAKLTGIKAISTPHGFENSKDLKLQLFIKLGCFSLRFFDYVIPLSIQLSKDLSNFKISHNKIKLILNGVDIDEIIHIENSFSEPLKLNPHEKIIGYIGQIASRKNVADLIKAFDRYYNKHKNSRLILIGDGPQKKALEKYATTLASANQIKFLGYRDDRLNLLKDFDLFCMTSSLEGIPRAMMEAMAMEVPVVAYDIPGVDNLIINGETGLMAEFGNIDQLIKCWEQLLLDDNFHRTVAEAGRCYLHKHFSARRMANEYVTLYNKLI